MQNSYNQRTRSNSRNINSSLKNINSKTGSAQRGKIKAYSSRGTGTYRKNSQHSRSPNGSKRQFRNLRNSIKIVGKGKPKEFILNVDDDEVEDSKSRSPVKRKEILNEEVIYLKKELKKVKKKGETSIYEIYNTLMQKTKFRYEEDVLKPQKWKNSNILLIKNGGYKGIKTGNTPNAKFCLASLFSFNKHELIISSYKIILIGSCFEIIDKSKKIFRNGKVG
jgi:hypothetical protein